MLNVQVENYRERGATISGLVKYLKRQFSPLSKIFRKVDKSFGTHAYLIRYSG